MSLLAKPLPSNTSAQKGELVALAGALQLGKDKRIDIYTDSKYLSGSTCPCGHLERRRTFMCKKKNLSYKTQP